MKNNNKVNIITKKTLAVLLACFLLVLIIPPVNAERERLDLTRETAVSGDFDLLKQRIIRGIDKIVEITNEAESKIANGQGVNDATKQITIDLLNDFEKKLLAYKTEVEAAATLEELKAINQEIIQYIRDNKDIIKESMGGAIADIANEVAKNIEKLKAEVEQILNVLKIKCPSEAGAISELEAQLEQLYKEINALKQVAQSKNRQAIKSEIQKAIQLSKDIVDGLIKIEAACF